tara:strand:+ start:976 stop:1089 length:114 start_codon:yes stop_codon:yes gene_type:complete
MGLPCRKIPISISSFGRKVQDLKGGVLGKLGNLIKNI